MVDGKTEILPGHVGYSPDYKAKPDDNHRFSLSKDDAELEVAVQRSEDESVMRWRILELERELAMAKLQLESQVPALLEAVEENLKRAVKAEKLWNDLRELATSDARIWSGVLLAEMRDMEHKS